VVVAIIIIITGMASVAFISVLPSMRANGAMQLMQSQLRQARETSIDQRRYVTVTFQGTNEMVTTEYSNPGVNNNTTQLSDFLLPYGMIYTVFTGVPNTPDSFGNTSSAVNFCSTLPCTITFQSDGTVLLNCSFSNGNCTGGTYTNGTVFMGISGQTYTARAVTILATTGRIRAYQYTGTAWY
jgi:type II secretory pathway pseudopilin PulG